MTESHSVVEREHPRTTLVPILVIGTFGILCTETGVIGVLPLLAELYGIDLATAGLFVSMFALAVAISGATLPAALSGLNRKTMMTVVLGAFTVGNLVFALAPTFEIALAARVIPALLHPVYCSAAYALAAASVDPMDAPRAAAKVNMGVSGGMVVGVPLATIVASVLPVQSALVAFALINAATLVATIVFVPSMPVSGKTSYLEQVSAVKSPLALVSLAATMLVQAAIFATYAYAAEFLADVGGVTGALSTGTLLAFGLASLLGNFLGGHLLSRKARATLIAFPLVVIATYGLLTSTAHLLPLFLAAVALWGVVYGFGNNVQQFVTSTAMPSAPDFANGLFISFGNIGITVGTSVGGFVLGAMGVGACPVASVAFSVLSLALLAARNSLTKAPERRLDGQQAMAGLTE